MTGIERWAGLYRILEDGVDVGTETWTREVGPDQVRLTSVVMRTDEEEFEEEIEITLEPNWRPVQVTIERNASDGDRQYVGRRVGSAWISQVIRESGPMRTATLPFDANIHVDYLTAHTNSVTMRRLALSPESGLEIDVVAIDPETYTPTAVRQKYARLADPDQLDISGYTATRLYRFQGSSGTEHLIWTTDEDIILRYEDLFEVVELNTVL